MEFVNRLTEEQIKEFIENTFNVRVKKVVIKDVNNSYRGVFLKIEGMDKVYFSFSDFRFNFPYIKFRADDRGASIRKQWYVYLTKIFGKEYALKLRDDDINQSIQNEKQLAEARIRIIKEKSSSLQSALQCKIDVLKSGIKNAQEQESRDIEKERQNLEQEIQELKDIQSETSQDLER